MQKVFKKNSGKFIIERKSWYMTDSQLYRQVAPKKSLAFN
jgi:hypothetical protein